MQLTHIQSCVAAGLNAATLVVICCFMGYKISYNNMNMQELLLQTAASPIFAGALDDFFRAYINPFVAFLTALAGVVIVVSIIAGGVQYSAAGADPSKVAAAKHRITSAIIALLCLIFLFAFIQWLVPGGLFGALVTGGDVLIGGR